MSSESPGYINMLYYLNKLFEEMSKSTNSDMVDIRSTQLAKDILNELSYQTYSNTYQKSYDRNNQLQSSGIYDDFKFDVVMNRLRSTILNKATPNDNSVDIEWLLKYLLLSPKLFKQVYEVDTFLANMTGIEHTTKNTGRDRIVEWYLREIRKLDIDQQNAILNKIAKHIFVQIPSNYKEWKTILYGENR